MTIGPIIGFVLQPIVGALSDHATFSYGRRRPIMIVGLIIWFIGSFSTILLSIYPMLTVTKIEEEGLIGFTVCDVFFVIFQVVIAIGINLIQLSHRSIILDQFDWADQNRVTLLGSVMLGFGQIVYYGLTTAVSFIFLEEIGTNKSELTKTRFITIFWLNVLSLLAMPITVYLFCHYVNESPYPSGNISIKEHFQNLWGSVKQINSSMYFILIVVFVGWFAWTPIKEYTQPYFMYYLFQDKQSLSFLYFNLNKLIFGITIAVVGIILFIINRIPDITMMVFNLLTGCVASVYYIPFDSINSEAGRYVVSVVPLIFSAMCYCQLTSLPYSLTRKVVKTDDFGFFVGLVNNSLTLSQLLSQSISIIIELIASNVAKTSSDVSSYSYSNILMFIVCPAFIVSSLCCLLLRVVIKRPDQNSKAMEEGEGTRLMK